MVTEAGLIFRITTLILLITMIAKFLFQGQASFWTNLGYIHRNKAIAVVKPQVLSPYDMYLTRAVRLFSWSSEFGQCNPFGFRLQSVVDCDNVEEWPIEQLDDENNWGIQAFSAPDGLAGIRYREVISLLLPEDGFTDLHELTIITAMGNSTRIQQGELVAYAAVITIEGYAYLLPLRAGHETAEWAYDFPDIPPEHLKPTLNYSLPNGGNGYPLVFKFEYPVSPKVVSILFIYAQHWHVQPGLNVWAVLARND